MVLQTLFKEIAKKSTKGPRGGKYIPAIDPKSRSLRESDYFYSKGKKYRRSEGEIITKDFPSGLRNIWTPLPGATPVPVVPHSLKQDFFTYKGKRYPKSEGVVERYTAPNTGRTYIVWTPKSIKGMKQGQNPMTLKQQKERKMIMDEMKQMDSKLIREMDVKDIKIHMKNRLNIDRGIDAIGNMRREAIGTIGSGSKKHVKGMHHNQPHLNDLSESGKETVNKFIRDMYDLGKGKGRHINYGGTLLSALNRMVYQAKKQNINKDFWNKLSDDALEEKILKKIISTDKKRFSEILDEKALLQRKVKQAREMGIDLDNLDLSHMEDVASNWERALDLNNFFIAESRANRYLQKTLNNRIKKIKTDIKKASTFAEKRAIASEMKDIRQQLKDRGLISEIEGRTYGQARTPGDIGRQLDNLINTQLAHTTLNRGGIVDGYAAGGIIKNILNPKLSRRKFLKGMGATVASAALPGSRTLAAPTVKSLMERRLSFAPPWVAKMTSALNLAVNKKGITKLPNGTTIEYIKGPLTKYDNHKLSVKTADGNEDLVNFKETKDSLEIEFDIRDEWHNNQHIHIDKKNKTAELIDENYYMTSPEDYAKDDPIIWDVSKKSLDKTIVLDKSVKADDYIYDYMSTPNDSDYSYLFERYIDSFSPAGNIFKTKEYAKQLRKKEALNKRVQEDRSMADWEEQFRGGHGMHAYKSGGMSGPGIRKKLGERSDKAIENSRMNRLRNMSDVEAMARMMFAESSQDHRDAYAIGHVIQNRANYQGPESTYQLHPNKNLSSIKRVLSGSGQFTPYASDDNLNFWDFDMKEEHPYYEYAKKIMLGQADDFTQGSTMFDLDPNKYAQGYNKYWNFDPSQFEHEGPHSFWSISPRMNRGGLTETVPPTKGPDSNFVEEGVEMIKENPQRFVFGGLVKKYAPNVLGKLTNYRPRLTGKGPDLSGVRADLYTPPKGPYTITNDSGVRVLDKDFKTLEEAQAALKELAGLRMSDASTFKIFGKRPPKTAEGVSEAAPEVNLGMVGKELPPEKPGAMFWGSREKIINAPYDIMTGKQWIRFLKGFDEEQVFAGAKKAESVLGALRSEGKVLSKDFGDKMKLYRGDKNHPEVVAALKAYRAHQIKVKKANDELARLKLSEREGAGKEFHERILTLRRAQEQFPPIKDMELNDTGLAPYLSQNQNKMISKEQLVKDFDTKLAPEIEVVALGREGAGREVDQLFNKMNNMDMQAYREGPIKNVLMGVRNRVHPLREAVGNNNTDAVLKIVDEIDNLTFDNFGVSNAIKEGFPQKFPFELKNILQRIAQISGARTAGFKKYTKDVQYRGQQTLSGGENYREFLFKYKHPSGSLRETEPMKQYSELGGEHFSSLSSKDQTGGFVHARVSDRTDEFGRRILHIEEIQSDLHQPVNAAARRVRKAEADGKRPSSSDRKKAKYAPRGDMIKESIDEANEQQLVLILSKIEDLASKPITQRTQIRLNRLNKERAKIRKIIEDKRAKMATGDHSGIPMGPLSKTEDYNEFVMKYMTKVAQEGGYDGVTISSGAIKNRGEQAGSLDWKGNMVAYGPIAEGAMKKVAKKSGAKFIKTSIIDDKGRGWEIPMIWLDDSAKFTVQKGMPIYRKGGMVVNG